MTTVRILPGLGVPFNVALVGASSGADAVLSLAEPAAVPDPMAFVEVTTALTCLPMRSRVSTKLADVAPTIAASFAVHWYVRALAHGSSEVAVAVRVKPTLGEPDRVTAAIGARVGVGVPDQSTAPPVPARSIDWTRTDNGPGVVTILPASSAS